MRTWTPRSCWFLLYHFTLGKVEHFFFGLEFSQHTQNRHKCKITHWFLLACGRQGAVNPYINWSYLVTVEQIIAEQIGGKVPNYVEHHYSGTKNRNRCEKKTLNVVGEIEGRIRSKPDGQNLILKLESHHNTQTPFTSYNLLMHLRAQLSYCMQIHQSFNSPIPKRG